MSVKSIRTVKSIRKRCRDLGEFPLQEYSGSREKILLGMADGTPAPGQLATAAETWWDDQALFVLFEGQFRRLRIAPPSTVPALGKTPHLWELSDVYEFFIGPDARETRKYREFQVAPDGRWLDIDVDRSGDDARANHDWVSGCRCASFVDPKNGIWRSALEIPWNALGAGPDHAGEWHCNFYRATGRFHGDELLSWSPTGYGSHCFHRIEHFGRLVIAP